MDQGGSSQVNNSKTRGQIKNLHGMAAVLSSLSDSQQQILGNLDVKTDFAKQEDKRVKDLLKKLEDKNIRREDLKQIETIIATLGFDLVLAGSETDKIGAYMENKVKKDIVERQNLIKEVYTDLGRELRHVETVAKTKGINTPELAEIKEQFEKSGRAVDNVVAVMDTEREERLTRISDIKAKMHEVHKKLEQEASIKTLGDMSFIEIAKLLSLADEEYKKMHSHIDASMKTQSKTTADNISLLETTIGNLQDLSLRIKHTHKIEGGMRPKDPRFNMYLLSHGEMKEREPESRPEQHEQHEMPPMEQERENIYHPIVLGDFFTRFIKRVKKMRPMYLFGGLVTVAYFLFGPNRGKLLKQDKI